MKQVRATIRIAWDARLIVLSSFLPPFICVVALSLSAQHFLSPILLGLMDQTQTRYTWWAAYIAWEQMGTVLRFALEAAAIASVLEILARYRVGARPEWLPHRRAVRLFALLLVAAVGVVALHQTARILIAMLGEPALGMPFYEAHARGMLKFIDDAVSFVGPWPLVVAVTAGPIQRVTNAGNAEGPDGLLARLVLAALLLVIDRASNLLFLANAVSMAFTDDPLDRAVQLRMWATGMVVFVLRELIFVAVTSAVLRVRLGRVAAGRPLSVA